MQDGTQATVASPSDAAVISRGMVKLLHEISGRGPTKARTTIGRDHVLVMLHETLTRADQALADAGRRETVLATRQALQEVMRPRAVRLVEETLRRQVVGFLSANHLEPDIAAEVFALAPLEAGSEGLLSEGEALRDGPRAYDGRVKSVNGEARAARRSGPSPPSRPAKSN